MRQNTKKKEPCTIGIDLGDRYSHMAVLRADGTVQGRHRFDTTKGAFEHVSEKNAGAVIVMEAGTHSGWASRVFEGRGHKVIVANPRHVRAIYESDNKTDWTDAETLARLGRADPKLLHPIHHRGEKAQRDLTLIRARDALVEVRTVLVNSVRGLLKTNGARAPKCDVEAFDRDVVAAIPEALKPALTPLVEEIKNLTEQIRKYDRTVEWMAKETYPETATVRQISGVGALTGLAFVLTLEEARRFKKSRAVGAFLGLVPRKDQSGDTCKQLPITKAGNGYLRRLLVNGAHYVLGPFGPDTDLRRFGLELAKRGGKNGKKRAVIAVARKMVVLMHRLWVTGEVYEPLRNAAQRGEVEAAATKKPAVRRAKKVPA